MKKFAYVVLAGILLLGSYLYGDGHRKSEMFDIYIVNQSFTNKTTRDFYYETIRYQFPYTYNSPITCDVQVIRVAPVGSFYNTIFSISTVSNCQMAATCTNKIWITTNDIIRFTWPTTNFHLEIILDSVTER